MGYMTTFMIFNDAEHNVEEHPAQVADNILQALQGKGMELKHDREFPIGNHANAMHALSPQHADSPQLLIAYQNNFVRFGHFNSLKKDGDLDYRKRLLEVAKRVLKQEEEEIQRLEMTAVVKRYLE